MSSPETQPLLEREPPNGKGTATAAPKRPAGSPERPAKKSGGRRLLLFLLALGGALTVWYCLQNDIDLRTLF